jgi:hypothetical protein
MRVFAFFLALHQFLVLSLPIKKQVIGALFAAISSTAFIPIPTIRAHAVGSLVFNGELKASSNGLPIKPLHGNTRDIATKFGKMLSTVDKMKLASFEKLQLDIERSCTVLDEQGELELKERINLVKTSEGTILC